MERMYVADDKPVRRFTKQPMPDRGRPNYTLKTLF